MYYLLFVGRVTNTGKVDIYLIYVDEWLAKYCILPSHLEEMYKKTFEVVDEGAKGWLSPLETIVALRATNRSLTEEQEEYIYRVSVVCGILHANDSS